jgi:N-methylhydantoinase A
MGDEMGYSAEEAAFDCWRVVNANMTQGVRRITAGKGIDPRGTAMLAYGGNGPAFATRQAEELGIERVLVPRASPTFSALGTLVADPAIDEERSYLTPASSVDPGKLRELWADLAARAKKYFTEAGFAADKVTAKFQLNMRYPGQNWVLTFNAKVQQGLDDMSFVTDGIGAQAIEDFNQRHMDEYGHIREDEVPEISGVRLATSVATASPVVGHGFNAPTRMARVAKTRRANLGEGFHEIDVFIGGELAPGEEIIGPAIIEETFTTLVVGPGWRALVDDAGDYEMTLAGRGR